MKAHRIQFLILYWGCALLITFFCFSILTTTACGKYIVGGGSSSELKPGSPNDTLNAEDDPFGQKWENLGLYGGQITALEIDPSNPNIMFAGTRNGDGLFMTVDGGQSWFALLTGQEGGALEGAATFRNTTVWSVKIAPGDSETIWAVHDIWAEKGAAGGFVWTHVANRLMQEDCTHCGGAKDAQRVCRSLAIDPADAKRVYVGTSGPYGAASGGAIYRTDDGGGSWIKTGLGSSYEFEGTVVDIAVHPQDPRTVWAIASAGGSSGQTGLLYISRDYGNKWERIFKAETAFYGLELWPGEPSNVFIATGNGIVSNLSGRYQYLKGVSGMVVRALAFDSQNPEVMYAAAGGQGIIRGVYHPDKKEFVFGKISNLGLEFITLAVQPEVKDVLSGGELNGGVFKIAYNRESDDFEVTDQNNGINALLVHDVDLLPAAGSNSEYLLAATETGVWTKTGEQRWQRAAIPGLPAREAFSVAFAPAGRDASIFYAGGQGYLALTVDGGKTWKHINRDLPGDMLVSDIAVAPDGVGLFITTRRINGGAGFVYASRDGGSHLKQVLASDRFDFNTVMIDPSDPKHIFAGGGNFFDTRDEGRLFQSFDGGAGWEGTGLKRVVVNALLMDPENPQTIFAGCGNNRGTTIPLFKSIDGGQTWKPSYEGIPGRPTRYGVWASSPDDVFVLGHTGSAIRGGFDDRRIMHFDGTAWSDQMDSGVSEHLKAIWGSGRNDIFAVGDQGAIVQYDGTRWAAMEPADKRTTLRDLNAVWGRSESEVYAVGDFGTILHYDGTRWAVMPSDTDLHLYGVWGDADCNQLYAVGAAGTILVYFNNRWHKMVAKTKAQLTGIWGLPCGKGIFAVGAPRADRQGVIRYTILRFDGKQWSLMDTPAVEPGKGKLHAVWGSSGTDVFAVGADGVILHFDGKTWTEMGSPTLSQMALRATSDLHSVWGLSSNQVFAAGSDGTILYYDGNHWKKVDSHSNGNPVERITPWNAVTGLGLKVDRGGNRKIYSSTERQGIYLSMDHGSTWRNLSAPPYPIFELNVGSVYVATWGVHTFHGQGLIVGWVKDELTGAGLPNGYVLSGSVPFPTDANGYYQIPLGAGNYSLEAHATGYKHEKIDGVPSLIDGNTVIFYLSDLVVYIRINGSPVQAAAQIFENGQGRIQAGQGDFASSNGVDYLKLPYPGGWVKLLVAAKPGYQINDLRVDNVSKGPGSGYTLTNLNDTHYFDAIIGAVSGGCPADYDKDGDVDGDDLQALVGGLTSATPNVLATSFGKTNCAQP